MTGRALPPSGGAAGVKACPGCDGTSTDLAWHHDATWQTTPLVTDLTHTAWQEITAVPATLTCRACGTVTRGYLIGAALGDTGDTGTPFAAGLLIAAPLTTA